MKQFKARKILVVGGAGFVGSNLVKVLLLCSPREIVIVDNLLSAERVSVPPVPEITFIERSITDESVLAGLEDDFDYIFHLATYHGNQSSINDPLADHENNTLTTLKLYEWIKTFKRTKKVVYSSAGCAVAEKTNGTAHATTEDAQISLYLDSPYQISKIIGEFYSNYYYKQYDLPVVKARFQNVYGPGEILGAGRWRGTPSTVWRNVVPTFIYKALRGTPLPLENNGIATRDFIYVDDVCRGLIACALRGMAGDVYNIATGKENTILELAILINKITNSEGNIEHLPKRAWDHSGRRYGSIEKAKRDLGFKAITSLQDGLFKTVEWAKTNMDIIQKSIDKHLSQFES